MSQQDLLARVVAALEAADVGYMVTGSVASSLLGEPRATHDIDIVVALRSAAVEDIVDAFPAPDFFVSADAAQEAVATRGMFNLLDTTHGDKVDFWLLTDEPFDRSRFAPRQSTNILGTTVWVSTPEDTVLAKLRWAEMSGGSEKQFVDALGGDELVPTAVQRHQKAIAERDVAHRQAGMLSTRR